MDMIETSVLVLARDVYRSCHYQSFSVLFSFISMLNFRLRSIINLLQLIGTYINILRCSLSFKNISNKK